MGQAHILIHTPPLPTLHSPNTHTHTHTRVCAHTYIHMHTHTCMLTMYICWCPMCICWYMLVSQRSTRRRDKWRSEVYIYKDFSLTLSPSSSCFLLSFSFAFFLSFWFSDIEFPLLLSEMVILVVILKVSQCLLGCILLYLTSFCDDKLALSIMMRNEVHNAALGHQVVLHFRLQLKALIGGLSPRPIACQGCRSSVYPLVIKNAPALTLFSPPAEAVCRGVATVIPNSFLGARSESWVLGEDQCFRPAQGMLLWGLQRYYPSPDT